MASYLAFMTGSQLGWSGSWRLIETGDWLSIRLPASITGQSSDSRWTQLLEREEWLRKNWQPNATSSLASLVRQVEHQLDEAVFDLYDLSLQERIMVNDTRDFNLLPFLMRKRDVPGQAAEAQLPQMKEYAARVCTQLNEILSHGDQHLGAVVLDVGSAPLRACRFSMRQASAGSPVRVETLGDVGDLLDQIDSQLREEVARHLHVKHDLRVYGEGGFWIIKPADSRLWSQAAALEDADVVVREHMEALPGGIPR